MFINIYKNWLNDALVGGLGSMTYFMEIERDLMEENEDLIDKIGLSKLKENGNNLGKFLQFLGFSQFYFIFGWIMFSLSCVKIYLLFVVDLGAIWIEIVAFKP